MARDSGRSRPAARARDVPRRSGRRRPRSTLGGAGAERDSNRVSRFFKGLQPGKVSPRFVAANSQSSFVRHGPTFRVPAKRRAPLPTEGSRRRSAAARGEPRRCERRPSERGDATPVVALARSRSLVLPAVTKRNLRGRRPHLQRRPECSGDARKSEIVISPKSYPPNELEQADLARPGSGDDLIVG
jgi:hypothetical protein